MKIITLLVAFILVASSQAYAHEHRDKTDSVHYSVTDLSGGLMMLKGEGGFTGGNIILLDGDDGLVMIDDGMPKFFDLLNAKIKELVGKPVDFIINTHLHGDHVGNNAGFAKSGAHIIAHDNVRKKLAIKEGPESRSLPVFTFNDRFTSHLNGQPMQSIHLREAHTDGDTAVYFPESNVIHAGDVFFNGMFPFIDLDNGGSVKGYIAAQTAIAAMANEKTKIVPGHGPLASKPDLLQAIKMLTDAQDKVQRLIDKGLSLSQVVAANPLKSYDKKWSWNFITTEKITKAIYTSLTSEGS